VRFLQEQYTLRYPQPTCTIKYIVRYFLTVHRSNLDQRLPLGHGPGPRPGTVGPILAVDPAPRVQHIGLGVSYFRGRSDLGHVEWMPTLVLDCVTDVLDDLVLP
jgi:hypothetical protein